MEPLAAEGLEHLARGMGPSRDLKTCLYCQNKGSQVQDRLR